MLRCALVPAACGVVLGIRLVGAGTGASAAVAAHGAVGGAVKTGVIEGVEVAAPTSSPFSTIASTIVASGPSSASCGTVNATVLALSLAVVATAAEFTTGGAVAVEGEAGAVSLRMAERGWANGAFLALASNSRCFEPKLVKCIKKCGFLGTSNQVAHTFGYTWLLYIH